MEVMDWNVDVEPKIGGFEPPPKMDGENFMVWKTL